MWRIGFLGASSAPRTAFLIDALRLGLREQGYVEGRNIAIEYCRPRILFSVQSVPVKERQVVVVAVREGGDKPYWVKDLGPLIRDGNRNRVMTREEVEHEFERP